MNHMSRRTNIITLSLLAVVFAALVLPACRKTLADIEATAVVDKIALHYGNDRIFNGILLKNAGEKKLSFQADEQIPWLEIVNPSGELLGRSSVEITCRVNRSGLERGNYSGEILLMTGSGNFTLDVYMNVDMILVTFINPVYTVINLRIDTVLASPDTNLMARRIGKNDSVQFGFTSMPSTVTWFAETSGRYTDSTLLGLPLDWKGQRFLTGLENPRFFLDVSKAYFHLSIINNNQTLNPLYVNVGTQFEMIENIFIYQSSDPLPIGYYHALENTVIRAQIAGESTSITWTNNGQFELPFTMNQAVVLDTYNNDSTKKKSRHVKKHPLRKPEISETWGDVFHLNATAE